MKIDGQNRIPASVEDVWKALNDPEILQVAIPGCEILEKLSDTEFKATVVTKVGPIKAKFNGQVELSDLNPPNSYTLSGRGSGGTAGNAKGSAAVRLEQDGEETLLTYNIDAEVTGKLAQLGQRLIVSTTKMLAGKFFNKLEELLSGAGEEEEEAEADAEALAELVLDREVAIAEAEQPVPPAEEALAPRPKAKKQKPVRPEWAAEPGVPPGIKVALLLGGMAGVILILIWASTG